MAESRVIIIGAGPAGLSVAAALRKQGVPSLILEQHETLAPGWRKHYDRLHLHTPKGSSSLPFTAFPRSYPRYPSKEQLIAYLETYAEEHQLAIRFKETVESVIAKGLKWFVTSSSRVYEADHVVIATGAARRPKMPDKLELSRFTGSLIHSSQYTNGEAYRGQKVLVVGFGNSAGEIALDLIEHNAKPCLSVRSAVNVIPRDLLGIPILSVALAVSKLPPRLADRLTAPILWLLYGNLADYELKKLPYGSLEQIKHTAKIPLLDIGTMKQVRSGNIGIKPDIKQLQGLKIIFEDDSSESFNALVFATGYEPALTTFLPGEGILNEKGFPLRSGEEVKHGLFFCGFKIAATGMLREINLEAQQIARAIAS